MSEPRGYIALGTLPYLREGWAIIPFVEKPHYWRLDSSDTTRGITSRLYRSACGLWARTFATQKPIVPGNFPKCKRCERSIAAGRHD